MKSLTRLMFTITICGLLSCSGDDNQSAADLTMPVVVEKIKRGPISKYVSTTGTVRAAQEEAVVAEVAGILNIARNNGAILNAGTYVQKGYLLAELDNPAYLLEVRVESQRLAMQNAVRELQKQEVLYKEGGVTEKELEIARKTELDARLNFEAAELKAAKLKIETPIPGFITDLQAGFNGTLVNVGFQLCKIMAYSTVSVEVQLPNSDINEVRTGQAVEVSNYALTGEIYPGTVTAINPTLNPQTRTFSVNIELDNKDLRLRPGMFVKTDIVVEHHPDAVLIPKTALQTREGHPVAFVVEGVSTEMRQVTIGIETKDDVEVIEGVTEGERLVVKGQETLRDKAKVRVTE